MATIALLNEDTQREAALWKENVAVAEGLVEKARLQRLRDHEECHRQMAYQLQANLDASCAASKRERDHRRRKDEWIADAKSLLERGQSSR